MSPALPAAVNYHSWVLDQLLPHVQGDVLEIGFGHAQYTRALAARARRLLAVDASPECVEAAGLLPSVELKVAALGDPAFARVVGTAAFDVAVCLNVLEHVQDDAEALRAIAGALRPGGRLLLFVPALSALYGPLDRLAGHFRRYGRRGLLRLLRETGYEPLSARYFNPLGGIGWWVNARFFRPRDLAEEWVDRQVIWFDRYVQPLSRLVDPLTRRVFGQSLLAVARRPAPGRPDLVAR